MCKFETPHKITVQKCYAVNKDKVVNIMGLETAKDLNIVKLQNVNKILVGCESCENIKLQNIKAKIITKWSPECSRNIWYNDQS